MLLLAAAILSVLTVRPAGGSLSALSRVRLRYAPAIFGALAIQIAIMGVVPGGSPWLHRALHIGSYALAAVFVVANRRIAGMRMLALGTTLNLIAILANNGVMPAFAGRPAHSGNAHELDRFPELGRGAAPASALPRRHPPRAARGPVCERVQHR